MSPLRAFNTCRARLYRATVHRDELIKMWNKFVENDPYGVRLEIDRNGKGKISVTFRYEEFPEQFSIVLGEFLYQLRGALDACTYGAAVQCSGQDPPPNPYNIGFPLCRTKETFDKRARNYEFLPDRCRKIIKVIQPYKRVKIPAEYRVFNCNYIFQILDMWSSIDRHHRLHVFGIWASSIRPTLNLPAGCTLVDIKVAKVGPLKPDCVIATFRLNGFAPGTKVKANPNLMIDITLDKVRRPCHRTDTFENRLNSMVMGVENIVAMFEQVFISMK